LWFKNGVKQEGEYDGGRETKDIIKWVVDKQQPASTKVSCDTLVEKIDSSQNNIVAYFGPSDKDEMFTKAHLPYAEEEASIQFYHNIGEDSCAFNIFNIAYPSIMVFRKFETK